jgi:hypothetical protein
MEDGIVRVRSEVFVPNKKEGFVGGVVTKIEGNTITVQLSEDESIYNFDVCSTKAFSCHRGPRPSLSQQRMCFFKIPKSFKE